MDTCHVSNTCYRASSLTHLETRNFLLLVVSENLLLLLLFLFLAGPNYSEPAGHKLSVYSKPARLSAPARLRGSAGRME
jgi:hypothetical protein